MLGCVALAAATGSAMAAGPTLSAVRAGEVFVAVKACEAFQSKNRRTNPGGVRTEPLRGYQVIARNAADGAYFQVGCPGRRSRRTAGWTPAVACRCRRTGRRRGRGRARSSTENLLVLSWQPAFCETCPAPPNAARSTGGRRRSTARLSIHGLWAQPETESTATFPQPGRARPGGRWDELPPVELDGGPAPAPRGDARHRELPRPARVAEARHLPPRSGRGGRVFRRHAAARRCGQRLAGLGLLHRGIGDRFATAEIRAAFDAAFGRGAGARVEVQCADDGGETLVRGLRISLRGEIAPETPVAELMLAADPVAPGCRGGLIDAPGLQ